jgi:hypothetical protein
MVKRVLRFVPAALGIGLSAVVLYAAASYPSGVKSFTTKTDGAGQTIFAAHINDIQDEIVAIEGALLNGFAHTLKPSGDAVSDLGTGGLRWRDLYLSRNAVVGGSLTVTAGLFGGVIQTTTATGVNNDFVLTAGATVLRCNNATLLTISGMSPGADGQRLAVVSIGAGQVDLPHGTSAAGLLSSAADRLLNFATVGQTSLAPGVGVAEYVYDVTTARWRLVHHDQGAWITRTFAAGNYTASAGTWTVASATRDAFWLKGRTLFFSVQVSGTTSGTPASVKVLIPNGYGNAANDIGMGYISNNGGGGTEAAWWQPSATLLFFLQVDGGAFAAGTVAVSAAASFEVQ